MLMRRCRHAYYAYFTPLRQPYDVADACIRVAAYAADYMLWSLPPRRLR